MWPLALQDRRFGNGAGGEDQVGNGGVLGTGTPTSTLLPCLPGRGSGPEAERPGSAAALASRVYVLGRLSCA